MNKFKRTSLIVASILLGIAVVFSLGLLVYATTLSSHANTVPTFMKALFSVSQTPEGTDAVTTVNGTEQTKVAIIWIASIGGALLLLSLIVVIVLMVATKKKKANFNTERYNQFDTKFIKSEYNAQRKDTALGYKEFKHDLKMRRKNSKKF